MFFNSIGKTGHLKNKFLKCEKNETVMCIGLIGGDYYETSLQR